MCVYASSLVSLKKKNQKPNGRCMPLVFLLFPLKSQQLFLGIRNLELLICILAWKLSFWVKFLVDHGPTEWETELFILVE